MRKAILALAVTLIIVTAGCAGGANPGADTSATTTAATDSTTTSTATDSTTTSTATDSTTTSESATAPMTGTHEATFHKVVDGDTFKVKYDSGVIGTVSLAAVNAPELNASENNPSDFPFHQATSESDAEHHKKLLYKMGHRAYRTADSELSWGDNVTVAHTGNTDEDGNPLVYLTFNWEGEGETKYNVYAAGYGMAVLTNESSPYAESIRSAQNWAKENNEGIWAVNEESEHSHE